jgi:hypothetical protein
VSVAVVFSEQVLDTRVRYLQSVSGASTRNVTRGGEESRETQTLSFTTWLLTSAAIANSVTATSLQDLRAFFECEFRAVPEVARVKIAERQKYGSRTVHVWTMLHKDDRSTRFKVYEVEEKLSELFPELLFEFHTHRLQPDAPDGDSPVYEQYES